MEIKDIVLKLVGEINPVGCASRDPQRLENIKTLCNLVDDLEQELQHLLMHQDSYESSVKACGDYVYKYFMNKE